MAIKINSSSTSDIDDVYYKFDTFYDTFEDKYEYSSPNIFKDITEPKELKSSKEPEFEEVLLKEMKKTMKDKAKKKPVLKIEKGARYHHEIFELIHTSKDHHLFEDIYHKYGGCRKIMSCNPEIRGVSEDIKYITRRINVWIDDPINSEDAHMPHHNFNVGLLLYGVLELMPTFIDRANTVRKIIPCLNYSSESLILATALSPKFVEELKIPKKRKPHIIDNTELEGLLFFAGAKRVWIPEGIQSKNYTCMAAKIV